MTASPDDRVTGNLLTGDSLYSGRLYIQDLPAYAASAKRLVEFVKKNPIAHVLGTHIENSPQPYFDCPRGTTYFPTEHKLELTRAHVFELDEALNKLKGKPALAVYPDFSLVPFGTPQQPMPAQAGNGAGLEAGTIPTGWKTGGPNCVTVPDWQVKEYNEDFYILRESGCVDAEKPFLYLIFGDKKALLEDTGVGMRGPDGTRSTVIPTAPMIFDLMAKWAKRKNHAPVSLVVIHSHSHGDHIAADEQFKGQPNVEFIAPTPAEISKFTGIKKWPTDIGQIDLGNRIIDVIPIPGHDVASITLYDRRTGNIMTGDSLYPGLLSVNQEDLATFAASSQRLTDFISDRPVAYVLGTHIEQKATPYADYGRGTVYQPEESALELSRAHIIEMNEAFKAMKGKLVLAPMPQTTIVPRTALRLQATPPPAAK